MLIFKILLGAFAYLQIGYNVIGRLKWSVWVRGKNDALGYVFFPRAYMRKRVGRPCVKGNRCPSYDDHEDSCPCTPIAASEDFSDSAKNEYLQRHAIFWPLPMLWSLVAGAGATLYWSFRAMTEGPSRLSRALIGQGRPAAVLTPVERAEAERDIEEALNPEMPYRALEAAENKNDRS